MTDSFQIADTITQAQMRSGYSMVIFIGHATQSSSRTIPYAELYRGRSSVMETPAEYLQRAAEDEKLRKVKR